MFPQSLVIIGQGYVGLPVAMRAVEAGYNVIGLDTDHYRIRRLLSGGSYIDDVPDRAVVTALASGRYHPSTDYTNAAGFGYAIIAVPTPLRDGTPDLRFVEDAAMALAPLLTPGATVVLESTTYPGTTDGFLRTILERGSGLHAGSDFYLGYSPERIDPGNPHWSFRNTPKVVAGINAASLDAVRGLYDNLVDRTMPVSGTREAETAKLLENTFRHVNIALVNELAVFAHQLNIDVWEAIDAAATKPFGFMRFTPGPGVGGHCLPIDPSYLSWEVRRKLGMSFRSIELANEINSQMPGYVVQRLTTALNGRQLPVNGARVLQLGLAYKKNSGDCRESPAAWIAQRLNDLGAQVRVVDSFVDPQQVPRCVTLVPFDSAEVRAADAVLIVTDHDDVDYALLDEAQFILDTRNRLEGKAHELL
jgi:nucleotide sugar dehydrogenase